MFYFAKVSEVYFGLLNIVRMRRMLWDARMWGMNRLFFVQCHVTLISSFFHAMTFHTFLSFSHSYLLVCWHPHTNARMRKRREINFLYSRSPRNHLSLLYLHVRKNNVIKKFIYCMTTPQHILMGFSPCVCVCMLLSVKRGEVDKHDFFYTSTNHPHVYIRGVL